jgi:hypothetical protein
MRIAKPIMIMGDAIMISDARIAVASNISSPVVDVCIIAQEWHI